VRHGRARTEIAKLGRQRESAHVSCSTRASNAPRSLQSNARCNAPRGSRVCVWNARGRPCRRHGGAAFAVVAGTVGLDGAALGGAVANSGMVSIRDAPRTTHKAEVEERGSLRGASRARGTEIATLRPQRESAHVRCPRARATHCAHRRAARGSTRRGAQSCVSGTPRGDLRFAVAMERRPCGGGLRRPYLGGASHDVDFIVSGPFM